MAKMRRLTLAVVVVLILIVLTFSTPVRAENLGPGGDSRIIVGDQVVGPYQLLATVSPEPVQVGTLTFVVRVTDPSTAERLRDVKVLVRLVHSEQGTELEHEATHKDAGNPVDYVAHIPIEEPGSGTAR